MTAFLRIKVAIHELNKQVARQDHSTLLTTDMDTRKRAAKTFTTSLFANTYDGAGAGGCAPCSRKKLIAVFRSPL
jgi:hypothetical protein